MSPVYVFKCRRCGLESDELRKIGDTDPPSCVDCKEKMERIFSPITAIFKGKGWNHGSQAKIRKRSVEQGKKFFKRHPDLQEMSEKAVSEK